MNKRTSEHNLYSNQDNLDELERKLREQKEVVVTFPTEELLHAEHVILGEVPEFREHAARQYVGAKLLQALEEKYPLLKREYNGSKHLPIFQKGDREAFREKSSYIYNVFDVKDILGVEDIHPERVHIIIKGDKSKLLRPGLLPLLEDNTPFDTNIYLPPVEDVDFLAPDEKIQKGK